MIQATAPLNIPARALALRLLSAGFTYPDAAWRKRFCALLTQAQEARVLPRPDLAALNKSFRDISPEQLEGDYFRLFGSSGCCPLDLAHHLSPNPFEQSKRLADIGGFYKAFGVEVDRRLDHLPAMLEFSAYLEIKRSYAETKGWEEREQIAKEAVLKFFGEILTPALEGFLKKLKTCSPPEFYMRLAKTALIFGGAS
ncbi:MAG: molecular chaperone TorD family protein [Elusimicrobia bacterium]|nr:molecular chaperone TorD family protein [Elusimicrobiota bacterium]